MLTALTASPSLQRQARRVGIRFDEVTALQPGDRASAATDRRTRHYEPSLKLVRVLLSGVGEGLRPGLTPAWGFLFRKPKAVEAGLRQILQARLVGHTVIKKSLALPWSTKTMNPDLAFHHGAAVGDVKYKLQQGDWSNDDLYHLVAFAAGYPSSKAVLVSFTRVDSSRLPALQVGAIEVGHVAREAAPKLPTGG